MVFVPGYQATFSPRNSDLCFVFKKGKLLTRVRDGRHHIPVRGDFAESGLRTADEQYLGVMGDRCCCAASLCGETDLPASLRLTDTDLRNLFGRLDDDLVWIAGRGAHLLYWRRVHRYCGRCGRPTENKADERALICTRCGLVNYPRLSPAVIVAVTRGDRILLARNKRFRLPFYSVLAGFVEPGENLEACVKREVREEVGVDVDDIRYFGSQPWPFPDSLMIGFTAKYAGGELAVDGVELARAGWFARDDLPPTPPSFSIAGQLIDAFVQAEREAGPRP